MRFLDRFVCKNPKQKASDHGGSIMQRTAKLGLDTKKEALGNQTSNFTCCLYTTDMVSMRFIFTPIAFGAL